ncbi:MAG: hypothetical protein GSR77_05210 [Desulfurococcales archaeon]|nr:hypothetical protein [Desulfurococcales archaeon]
MIVGVDYAQCEEIGKIMRRIIDNISIDKFEDQRYYPPLDASREEVTRYFLVMVALDHRLSRPGKPYEGFVDDEFYHGADLLYRLGRKYFDEKPEFFDPNYLQTLRIDEFVEMFTVKSENGRTARPPDPEIRVGLLRDLARKLVKLYGESAYSLITQSRGYLRRGTGEGFIDRLKIFTAYQDPVEKKPFLLAKFLERRGILPVYDPYNKEVPVDNHLVRIAIRLGIIKVDTILLEKIAAGIEVSPEEDIVLRYNTRIAYKLVSQHGGIDPFIMDDFLWMFGRKCCTRETPVCMQGCRKACSTINGCSGEKCVFHGICSARRDPLLMVNEHKFLNTWWY